jgi:type II secretory pathway component PulF
MPYFSWKGVDIEGSIHKGKLFAQSKEELDALLFKQEIALIGCSQVKQISLLNSISFQDKIQFFKQLGQLLNAGVLLPDALLVATSQAQQIKFQTILSQITQQVHEGNALSQSLANQNNVFDAVMVHMVKVGEESGKLSSILAMLGDYLQMRSDFGKNLRSALLMPSITFAFFFCITLFIFVFIIPQFAHLFQSNNQTLPQITKNMLAISDFVTSQAMVYFLALAGTALLALYRLIKTKNGKCLRDIFVIKIPIFGPLIKENSLGYFLHAVSMLLQGSMPLPQAIQVAKATVSNDFLVSNLTMIEQDILAGSSLSQAMIHNMAQIFDAPIIAMIRVGEESGRLASLLGKAGHFYQSKVHKTLAWIVTIINPLLMIALGALITFLIVAVYVPIFNLSDII